MNLAADTVARSNAVHIRLIISNVCSCEWLIKPVLLFYCRYETVQRTGTSVDGDPASEYYVLMLGGGESDLPSVYKERYHTGKQKHQHIYFNTKTGGTFNATCGQRVPTGTFPFYYKKKDRQCTYNVTMRRVRVMFIPPRLS